MTKEEINKILEGTKDFSGANLSDANLSDANLSDANLSDANLSDANLSSANLYGANLSHANLSSANLSFLNLLICNWGELGEALTLECMRQDASLIGIEKINKWAAGGECPYSMKPRDLIFNPKRELWVPGKPRMTIGELIRALCKEKNIELKEESC